MASRSAAEGGAPCTRPCPAVCGHQKAPGGLGAIRGRKGFQRPLGGLGVGTQAVRESPADPMVDRRGLWGFLSDYPGEFVR